MYEIYILCGKIFKITFTINYAKLIALKDEIIQNTSSWEHIERKESTDYTLPLDDHYGNVVIIKHRDQKDIYLSYDYFYYPPLVDEINRLLASEKPDFSHDLIIQFRPSNYYYEPFHVLDNITTISVIEYESFEKQAQILSSLADELLRCAHVIARNCSEELYFDELFSCFEINAVQEMLEPHSYVELNSLSDYLQKALLNVIKDNISPLKYRQLTYHKEE